MRRAIIVLALAALTVTALAEAQQVTKQLSLKFGTATVDGAAVWAEIEDAVCYHYGYQATVPALDAEGLPILDAQGQPTMKANPEARAVFVRRAIKKFLTDHRTAYLDAQGAEQGKAAARAGRKAESEQP